MHILGIWWQAIPITWSIILVNGVLVKSPAILEAVEPLPMTKATLSNAAVDASSIPRDFKVNIVRQGKTVDMTGFYLNSIQITWWQSIYPFFDSSDGQQGGLPRAPKMSVTPSESIYPHLQHCHIVWSIVKLAEDSYFAGDYRESSTLILLKLRSGWNELGTLLVEQGKKTNTPAPAQDLASGSESPGQAVSIMRRIEEKTKSPASNDDTMHIQTGIVRNGRPLQDTNVFLTVIRAIALLAEADPNAELSSWHFVDVETNVRVVMGATVGVTLKTTVGNVAEGLKYIAEDMVTSKRFLEMIAIFYQQNPIKVDYGSVMVMKLDKPVAAAS